MANCFDFVHSCSPSRHPLPHRHKKGSQMRWTLIYNSIWFINHTNDCICISFYCLLDPFFANKKKPSHNTKNHTWISGRFNLWDMLHHLKVTVTANAMRLPASLEWVDRSISFSLPPSIRSIDRVESREGSISNRLFFRWRPLTRELSSPSIPTMVGREGEGRRKRWQGREIYCFVRNQPESFGRFRHKFSSGWLQPCLKRWQLFKEGTLLKWRK